LPDLLHDVSERILPYPMGNGHPRFFGWVNSPPSRAGVMVAPLAAAMNPSCAGGDHAGVLLERTVVRWLAELVGFPHRPGAGLLTSGASIATVICLATARQRAALAEQLAEARAGRAGVVLLAGAPGIGKTRLEREFSRLVGGQGGRVLRGRCLPYGEQTGYGAFALQIKGLAGILETDPAPAARAKLEEALAPLFPGEPGDDLASQLAVLVGVGEGTPTTDRQNLFFLARRVVEALGRDRPTALVFEDLHWADPSLLDLLEYLAARVRDAPALLLALARPELLDARPGWGGGRRAVGGNGGGQPTVPRRAGRLDDRYRPAGP
jgi:hypothetical protein